MKYILSLLPQSLNLLIGKLASVLSILLFLINVTGLCKNCPQITNYATKILMNTHLQIWMSVSHHTLSIQSKLIRVTQFVPYQTIFQKKITNQNTLYSNRMLIILLENTGSQQNLLQHFISFE